MKHKDYNEYSHFWKRSNKKKFTGIYRKKLGDPQAHVGTFCWALSTAMKNLFQYSNDSNVLISNLKQKYPQYISNINGPIIKAQ